MQNRYFIMRHGESKANRKGLIVSHSAAAISGYGLTNYGAEQVSRAGFKTRLQSSTLIISSDFLRAKETAEILSGVICAEDPIQFDTRLRERDFGNWEQTDDVHYEEVWLVDQQSPNRSTNGVEPVNSVLNRGLNLINDLEARHVSRDILLVGHGDGLQILLAFQMGIEARYHRTIAPLHNAEIRCLTRLDIRQIA